MPYKNILLIDDDEDDQEIFLLALEKVSATVSCTTLSDAAQALEQLMARTLTPDVIFLDLNMPVMNGQQFLSEIKKKKELQDLPVIIFSTSFHPATIKLTRDMGAKDFITKPGTLDALVSVLRPIIND